MMPQPADLSNCDREPIHIPGKIQSHGFLLLVNDLNTITAHSSNISLFVPAALADLTGRPLQYFESLYNNGSGSGDLEKMIFSYQSTKDYEQVNPLTVQISGQSFYVILSQSDNQFIFDFEPAVPGAATDIQRVLGYSIGRLLEDRFLPELLQNCATQTRAIIGFDRVMIYKFAEDGHGEVVAEAKNNELVPWLGLHYPASDIPKQARELYRINLTRLIADVEQEPVGLVYQEQLVSLPVDLTHAQLRAVSPIHIQYLKNMGVATSYSISIVYKDRLWGLIACHNYTTKGIDYQLRQATKLIGQLLSSALEFQRSQHSREAGVHTARSLENLSSYLLQEHAIEDALVLQPTNILDVTDATGAILHYNNQTFKLGVVPGRQELDGLTRWLFRHTRQELFYTSQLSTVYPEATSFKTIGSGLMLLMLSKETHNYIIWFKEEVLRKVNWAGDPGLKAPVPGDPLGNISPRNSFDTWVQEVTGTSDKWSSGEIESALQLKGLVSTAINSNGTTLLAVNEELKKSYAELDTFCYTISHDLKNPITAIKGYTQLLKIDPTVPDQSRKILGRIEERVETMKSMIDSVLEYSKLGRYSMNVQAINVRELLKELVHDAQVAMPDSSISVEIRETPFLKGDPTMIAQVFSNLMSNAIKYSGHTRPAEIIIEGVMDESSVTYSVKDNGLGIAADDLQEIFLLFNRMDNVKGIEGTGVGLAIVKRIMDKHHGTIWVNSTMNEGSTFYLRFPLLQS